MNNDAAHQSIFKTSDFIGLVAIVLGAVIEYTLLWDWSLPLPIWMRIVIGVVFVCIGVGFVMASHFALKSTNQSAKPGEETLHIVITGIYRYTRNPIYLGLGILIFGLGVMFNFISWIALSIFVVITLHFVLVIPEEKYLLEKFPIEYSNYKKKVKRWI